MAQPEVGRGKQAFHGKEKRSAVVGADECSSPARAWTVQVVPTNKGEREGGGGTAQPGVGSGSPAFISKKRGAL